MPLFVLLRAEGRKLNNSRKKSRVRLGSETEVSSGSKKFCSGPFSDVRKSRVGTENARVFSSMRKISLSADPLTSQLIEDMDV